MIRMIRKYTSLETPYCYIDLQRCFTKLIIILLYLLLALE